MENPRLPDFLIVGTMKSGTSSLADYLAVHPDVHVPEFELHFFDDDEAFSAGPSWYAERLTEGLDGDPFRDGLRVGEKTPTYSYQENCAERIHRVVPDAKLVWIFREPVARTFSNYLHARKSGKEPLSFRRCVEREEERIRKNVFHGYVERSKYVLQVERFLEYFDLSRMHFLLFENLVGAPRAELNATARFLGISEFGELPTVHSNKTVLPPLPMLLSFARRLGGDGGFASKVARKVNAALGTVLRLPQPSVPEDLAAELADRFAPYNERLSELTGLDLQSWSPGLCRNSRLTNRTAAERT